MKSKYDLACRYQLSTWTMSFVDGPSCGFVGKYGANTEMAISISSKSVHKQTCARTVEVGSRSTMSCLTLQAESPSLGML